MAKEGKREDEKEKKNEIKNQEEVNFERVRKPN